MWYNDVACWLKQVAEQFPGADAKVLSITFGPPTNGQTIHATLRLDRPEDPIPDLPIEVPVLDCPK